MVPNSGEDEVGAIETVRLRGFAFPGDEYSKVIRFPFTLSVPSRGIEEVLHGEYSTVVGQVPKSET